MKSVPRVTSLLVVMSLSSCASLGSPSTQAVVACRLGVTDTGSEEAVRSQIHERLPRGTPEAAVERFLRERSIGEGAFSILIRHDRAIVCVFRDDNRSLSFVREKWVVTFAFDHRRRLDDILVDRHLIAL